MWNFLYLKQRIRLKVQKLYITPKFGWDKSGAWLFSVHMLDVISPLDRFPSQLLLHYNVQGHTFIKSAAVKTTPIN